MGNEISNIEAFKPGNMQLEECLKELEKYGNPRISKTDGAWHCAIEVFVIGKGTEFRISSGFKHKTHSEAANTCYSRLMDELERIKKTT